MNFTLDVINSMDGDGQFGGGPDFFNVSINGPNVFHYTFANYGHRETQSYPIAGSSPTAGAATVNTLNSPNCCGNDFNDSTYTLSVNGFANALGILSVVFNDASNEGYTNEHYGIDNVAVDGTFAAAATPLPGALPLFATGLAGFGWFARRRRKQAEV